MDWEGLRTWATPIGVGERVLRTILFTDIVESTPTAQGIGELAWSDLLARHNEVVRRAIADQRGQEVETTGDGFLATFDGSARAIRCAFDVQTGARALGLDIRAGIHTGEVDLVGLKVRGIAVHEAARLVAAATPGEILVSEVTHALAAGSGLRFEDRGLYHLKGLDGDRRLFAALPEDIAEFRHHAWFDPARRGHPVSMPPMDGVVLVLNQNYEPLNVCNLPRAFRLVFGEKAEVVEYDHQMIRTPRTEFRAPSVIRLQHHIRRPRPRVKLTRREIFARDGHRCQYCGRQTHDLTLDHVVPRHRGGGHTWENLVTACKTCNHRKGGKLLDEARLRLVRSPFEPRSDVYSLFTPYLVDERNEAWRDYLFLGRN